MNQFTLANWKVLLQWIPSHSNIPGNEIADTMAKAACSYDEVTPFHLEYAEYRTLLHRSFQNYLHRTWASIHNRLHMGQYIDDFANWSWTSTGIRLADVLISRFRTGCAGTNTYLHKIGQNPSPFCSHCLNIEETTQHLILYCPQYDQQRSHLFTSLRNLNIQQNEITLKLLLSGGGFSPDKKKQIFIALFQYFKATKRSF